MGKKVISQEAQLYRKLRSLWQRGQSAYCEARNSPIHGSGVYATQFIPKGTAIIEYVGERIDKQESQRRGLRLMKKAEKDGSASVYIFTLSKQFDIDGDVPWNQARLINHSCEPNCEAWTVGRKIVIHALEDIGENTELTFDYGFDVSCYQDNPCRCGKPSCVGYIVSKSQWSELKQILER